MSANYHTFKLYRYQILPIDRYLQADMFDNVSSVEDLIAKKNIHFAQALNSHKDFSNRSIRTVVKKIAYDDDFVLYQMAQNKKIHRETENFTNEHIDTWPSIYVAVWNDPERQLIAVQHRPNAFTSCDKVVKLILNKIKPQLSHVHLTTEYEPMFDTKDFWNLLHRYQGKVKSVEFELITPNMANISGNLPDDLKSFAKETNSVKNTLRLESESDSALHLEEDNDTLNGLVDYSGNGGGNISMKIDGLSKKLQTTKTVKEVTIGDMELTGSSDNLVSVMKELLKL